MPVSMSHRIHTAWLTHKLLKVIPKAPKESLKACICDTAGLSEARSMAHCIMDVIPGPFSLAEVPGLWVPEQHSHLELNLGDR